MKFKICEKKPFRVFGVRRTTPYGGGTWGIVKSDGSLRKMQETAGEAFVSLGLCFGFDEEGNNDYMCGFESDADALPGFEKYECPESAWLVFDAKGSISENILGSTWKRIYGEFLPQSEYRQRDLPTVERYCLWDEKSDRCDVEIMIPVERSCGPAAR